MDSVTASKGGNSAFHNAYTDFAHIQDPNERRRLALAEIDKAPFGWYHVRACVVAGVVSTVHSNPSLLLELEYFHPTEHEFGKFPQKYSTST
jgi:hypothetical protein